jgi:hypothetical protein
MYQSEGKTQTCWALNGKVSRKLCAGPQRGPLFTAGVSVEASPRMPEVDAVMRRLVEVILPGERLSSIGEGLFENAKAFDTAPGRKHPRPGATQ